MSFVFCVVSLDVLNFLYRCVESNLNIFQYILMSLGVLLTTVAVADPDLDRRGCNCEFGLSMLCLGISYCGKPIRVTVRPHRFTRHGIIEEKTFSVIKGKVWLPQAKFFP